MRNSGRPELFSYPNEFSAAIQDCVVPTHPVYTQILKAAGPGLSLLCPLVILPSPYLGLFAPGPQLGLSSR